MVEYFFILGENQIQYFFIILFNLKTSALLSSIRRNNDRFLCILRSLRSGSQKGELARNPMLCHFYSFSQKTRNLIGSK
jgi:hypothetical protein